jgi:cobalamin biosynthesis protein CobT
MKKDNKQRLFEVMGRLDKTFKPKAEMLNEWNFDKKKGEDKEDKEEKEEKKETSGKKKWNFEKKDDEDKETKEHEESETPEEEKEEHEEKKDLDEAKPKIPVNAIAKVGK